MHLTKEKRKLVTLERIRSQYQIRMPKGAGPGTDVLISIAES
jgi:ribonuclease HIII